MSVTQDRYRVTLTMSGKLYVIPKRLTKDEVTITVIINGVEFYREGNNDNNIIAFLL